MPSRRVFLGNMGIALGSLAGPGRATSDQEDETLISGQAQEKIIGTFVTFYQEIPDEPRERYAGVWGMSKGIIDTANSVLAQVPAIDEVADLEDFAEPIAGLLRNISENLAMAYDIHIETKYLDNAVRVTGYLPLLAQIWNLLQASLGVLDVADTKRRFVQKVRQTDSGKTAVEHFYIAMLLLFTELVFLWSGVGYRTAFGTTRRAANFGLVRLREQVGLRGYSVLLSIVHWLVRGSFETTVSYIVEKTGEIAQDISIKSIDFSPLSAKEITKSLPLEDSNPTSGIDIGNIPFIGDQVESTATSVIDASTKTALIERYGGLGIIEAKNTEVDGSNWISWLSTV